jgi:nitronate monooxygenase
MDVIPKFNIGELEIKLIQGGMGVGISGARLASAVANCGGAGIIASVGLGTLKNFPGRYVQANIDGLKSEIKKARDLSDGVIGVNIMRALTNYKETVQASIEEGVHIIITGAGPALDLPDYIGSSNVKIIPIVNSSKGADTYCRVWEKRGHSPDAIIVEGPKAGGHLAYTLEQLNNPNYVEKALSEIVQDVSETVKKYNDIPVIAAGGIFYGGDIIKANEWGAKGVQMATRFVCTDECDAHYNLKKAYLDVNEDGLMIIKSPVGLPGRAIINDFLQKTHDVKCNYHCLKTCKPNESPYCIADALINAYNGNLEEGFAFAGLNAHKCHEIISVAKLFEKLEHEYKNNIRS